MNIKDDTIQYFLKIITLVFGILLLFNIDNAIGYFVNEHKNARSGEMKVKVDTLFICDTIFIEKPVIRKVEIIDTLLLPVPYTDTLMLHDTVLVHLPIEQLQYSDPRYTAWVSGYRPQLDSIQIYQRTEYITKEIKTVTKPKRWGIGLQAGYGVSLHKGQVFPAPYIAWDSPTLSSAGSILSKQFIKCYMKSGIGRKNDSMIECHRFREDSLHLHK